MFTNTVHEPGPPVTLKYHRSKNQFKKPSQMHKHPASPAGTPRSALARPGARMAAVSWPCPQPCRGKGSTVSQQQCRSSRAHPPARSSAPPTPAPVPPSAPASRLPRAPCTPSTHARPAPTCAPRAPPARPAARLAPAQLHNLLQYDFQPTAPKFIIFFS